MARSVKGKVFGGRNACSGDQTGNFGNWLVDFTYRDPLVVGDQPSKPHTVS